MTIKDQIALKKAELAELTEDVENGDEEATEKAEALMAELDELNEKAAKAEKKKALLASMKAAAPVEPASNETSYTSLGDFAAKNLNLEAIRSGNSKSASTGFGFKAATDVHMAPAITVIDRNVVDNVRRNLAIRSLFGSERISGNAIQYFVLGATEGAATEVAEGAEKPQLHVPYEPETATLTKVAGWFYETDELLEDAPYLRSAIDNRGLFELDQAIEKYLMTTLMGTSGIQTIAEAPTADNIFKAIMNVKSATNYEADAIVINPADYQTLRLAKDGNEQYYGGGYFYGPYGADAISSEPGLWGLTTIVSTAVPEGTVLVGAFGIGATVITKDNAGARIEVHRGDHDDAICNRVTVVVEERLALATRVPAAFVKVAAA